MHDGGSDPAPDHTLDLPRDDSLPDLHHPGVLRTLLFPYKFTPPDNVPHDWITFKRKPPLP